MGMPDLLFVQGPSGATVFEGGLSFATIRKVDGPDVLLRPGGSATDDQAAVFRLLRGRRVWILIHAVGSGYLRGRLPRMGHWRRAGALALEARNWRQADPEPGQVAYRGEKLANGDFASHLVKVPQAAIRDCRELAREHGCEIAAVIPSGWATYGLAEEIQRSLGKPIVLVTRSLGLLEWVYIDAVQGWTRCLEERAVIALGERSKTNSDAPSQDAVSSASVETVNGVHLETMRSLVAWRRSGKKADPKALVLAGFGPDAERLAGALGRLMGMEVTVFSGFPPGPALHVRLQEGGARLCDAAGPAVVGLLLRWARTPRAMRSLNLAPRSLRVESWLVRRRHGTTAGLVSLSLLTLTFLGQAHGELTATETAWRELVRQNRSYETTQQRCREELLAVQLHAKQLAGLQSLAKARGTWRTLVEGLLAVAQKTPDVWLTTLEPSAAPRLGGSRSNPSSGNPEQRLTVAGAIFEDDEEGAAEKLERRMRQLLRGFREIEGVNRITEETYDRSEGGLLKFVVVLVISPEGSEP